MIVLPARLQLALIALAACAAAAVVGVLLAASKQAGEQVGLDLSDGWAGLRLESLPHHSPGRTSKNQSKLKGIKRPAQSDVGLAMRVAESTEGPS